MSHVVVDNPHGLDQQVSALSTASLLCFFPPCDCGDFPLRTCSLSGDERGAKLRCGWLKWRRRVVMAELVTAKCPRTASTRPTEPPLPLQTPSSRFKPNQMYRRARLSWIYTKINGHLNGYVTLRKLPVSRSCVSRLKSGLLDLKRGAGENVGSRVLGTINVSEMLWRPILINHSGRIHLDKDVLPQIISFSRICLFCQHLPSAGSLRGSAMLS